MLPDWPRTKREIAEFFTAHIRSAVHARAGLAGVTSSIIHEGATSSIQRPGEEPDEMEIKSAESVVEIKNDTIKNSTILDILIQLEPMIEDISSQIGKKLISTIEEIIEKTGNSVDGKGSPLTAELIIEAFEKIEVDFKSGQPVWPTLTINPSQESRVKNEISRLSTDPVLATRIRELTDRKREAYRAREAARILVG